MREITNMLLRTMLSPPNNTLDAVEFTNKNWHILAGKPFELRWTHAIEPVVIELWEESGPGLQFLQQVAQSATGSSYPFNPPANLSSGTYAFKIFDKKSSSDSPTWRYNPAVRRSDWRPGFGGLMGALLVISLCAAVVVLLRRRRARKLQRHNVIERTQEGEPKRESSEQIPRLSNASSITVVEGPPRT
ncbi:hypothetical protein F4779DRAFT_576469 [Xylariaceae sp. FL0662B]|nr:hypothetical protein F4779DRAFT_576469 [Xylariaceae sp. FL0662B]